jgi:hypothetical protein
MAGYDGDQRESIKSPSVRESFGLSDYASAAYQYFLTLWKDADPEIPILIAAKAEYAKLK